MVNNINYGYVYTTSTINPDDLDMIIERIDLTMTKLAIEGGWKRLYAMSDTENMNRLFLYLIQYALESWDKNDDTVNYMTEIEMISLCSKAGNIITSCAADCADIN